MTQQTNEAQYVTWRIPVGTPPWDRNIPTMYVDLFGSQIRLVKGKKYTTRVIEAGEGEPLILIDGVGGRRRPSTATSRAWRRTFTSARSMRSSTGCRARNL